jgi:divalent metal cation (Fe/Co/Zn/Cd) transporter
LRNVERVNEVLTMHMGPGYILVNLSIEFNDSIRAEQLESVIAKMDKDIRQQFAHVKRVFLKRNLGNLPSDCLDKYGSRFV